ncbi:MAG: UDP-N-acetylglucosamine 2-epimerase (non-hydrolyzing) [Anaerolineae bacterium]|nr:UDP-N-acetylglucosamine 2-epimerase (non-hydrolyzing) [Anaerolineae bacterium]
MKILSILGTRPEAVKMAPVIQTLAGMADIQSRLCVTGQHRQMLDQVLSLFDIKPDYDLNLMRPDQNLAELSSQIFANLDPVLADFEPNWVLIQGDTTTVLIAAVCAFYRKVHIGHIEAGLRTGDKYQPFPEEINRRMVSVVADLNFAPTEHSRQNLLREGIDPASIVVTGNPVIDALNDIVTRPAPPVAQELLARAGVLGGKRLLVLVTAHRRENFGQPIENICHALRDLAGEFSQQITIIYPVHLNPNILKPVQRLLNGVPNILLVEPLDYLPLVQLMKHAHVILTDSGGIQEEATALRKPTLVLRQVTERPEGVSAGVLKLVGTERERIVAETRRLIQDPQAIAAMTGSANPFGDGHAAARIVQAVVEYSSR